MNPRDMTTTLPDGVTENAMPTFTSSLDHCVDLFFSIGAMRGQPKDRLLGAYSKAHEEDRLTAAQILFWSRDVRGGAGERQIFRDIIRLLADTDPEVVGKNLYLIPEYGRWDDVLALVGTDAQPQALDLIADALADGHGLCAKWMPRQGPVANVVRKHLGLSPKDYRQLLAGNTNVVETQMCAREWGNVNYSHVPSLAAARYQKAFLKHDEERYRAYLEGLKKGEGKIHAGAVYPYDVVKSLTHGNADAAQAQWDALPNYMEGSSGRILPICDVSASMTWTSVGGNKNLYPMDVCLSLGAYLAERNEGVFQDLFMTFSTVPQLVVLGGSLQDRISQIRYSSVGGSTDLLAAFELILSKAKEHQAPPEDLPDTVLILSDMEFNACSRSPNQTAYGAIRARYQGSGYTLPRIVFWNLQARHSNVPARGGQEGVALVSGFSPAIMTSVLRGKDFTPRGVMMETISRERYAPVTV